MSYHKRLNEEIQTILNGLEEKQAIWDASWVAHEVCNMHQPGLAKNDESLFWSHCGYTEARAQVTKCIAKRASEASNRGLGAVIQMRRNGALIGMKDFPCSIYRVA